MNVFKALITKIRLVKNPVKYLRNKGAEIGKDCNFYNVKFDEPFLFLLKIGDNCTLTNCILLLHDASSKKSIGFTKFGGISIGNNCFIGLGAVILPGVCIGDNVIVGANTIVTKSLESNSVYVTKGGLLTKICSFDEFKQKHQNELLTSLVINKKPSKLTSEEKNEIKAKICEEKVGYIL